MREYLCWNFWQNQALFEGEKAPNATTKIGHFMDVESVQKPLKIYNLTTINAILMKLTTIM